MKIAAIVSSLYGGDVPFRVEAFDGSTAGPWDAPLTLRISRRALRRMIASPGQVGLARAYVSGDLAIAGSLDALVAAGRPDLGRLIEPRVMAAIAKAVGLPDRTWWERPSIEAAPSGALHSRSRDQQAVSHHYDVSNEFYELVLGPSMTYSCAVFAQETDSLEMAQAQKLDLVAQKLALRPGMRLLDVGCGWGAMCIHAARRYGVEAVGITLSERQQSYADKWAHNVGVGDLVSFRLQDYRDVVDGPYDAISSIGMSEHVGRRSLEEYIDTLYGLLRPGGRLLNHAIGRPVDGFPIELGLRHQFALRQLAVALGSRWPSRIRHRFFERYIFPDGELHEVGTMVSMLQTQGFEVRHLESLREHYVLTLRRWVANLEGHLDEAVEEVGPERVRAWLLYMTASAASFASHRLEVHQVLCARPDVGGSSGMALRQSFA